jgi:hypothetical protein
MGEGRPSSPGGGVDLLAVGREGAAGGASEAGEIIVVTSAQDGAGPALLGIYLNDHLAGATAGVELAHRMARSQVGPGAAASTLQRLAAEIAQDRSALRDIMASLGVPARAYKVGVAWLGEKAGRLKFNGRLRSRSPLSNLEELEMLRLGVEGKAAGWRTLRVLADSDRRLDASRLDDLLARARRQADLLEELRVRAADEVIATPR